MSSAMTQEEYVEHDGNHCPFCASGQLTGGPITVEAGVAWQEVVCDDCGNAWHDQYQLTGFSKIEGH